VEQTKSHLDLLGAFHYVAAGLLMLCGGGYFLVMFGVAAVMQSVTEHTKDPMPPEFLWLFGGVGIIVAASMATTAFLIGLAGWCLRERKAWIYCLIIAALSLPHAPIGTVLGVFTIIVLLRPEAKALFAATRS
jgi:hypothetical protein